MKNGSKNLDDWERSHGYKSFDLDFTIEMLKKRLCLTTRQGCYKCKEVVMFVMC
jgi:hypothetical protein